MYLKRLELHGFKSFHEKTVFEFNKGITAVVGPNGSGKSNIADAVRWALGEQSVRSLRGQKMEDVIFSGTESRRGTSFAEVTLVLCNEDNALPEYGAEAAVSRRLYRSGESQYLINGVAVRLRDVHELFMDTGLGREGYSIIGQGRIEDVLSTRSEDRRALFEEAAGITKYKSRRDDAVSKLERERRGFERACDIISEIEAQLEPMKDQAEKAKRYLSLMERLKAVKINAYALFLEGHDEQRQEQEQGISNIQDELLTAEQKREDRKERAQELREGLTAITGEIAEINAERSALTEKILETDGEIKLSGVNITYIDERKERVLADIESRKSASLAFSAERVAHLDKLAAITEELIAKDEEASFLRESLLADNKTLSEREEDLERFNLRHIESLRGVTDVKARVEGLNSTYAELEKRKEEIGEAKEQAAREYAKREAELAALEAELAGIKSDSDALTLEITGFSENKNKLDKSYTDLKNVFKKEQSALNENRSKQRILSGLERSREGYQYSVKNVLDAAASGKLSGVHGAVGDLISAQARYEMAVEVALGGGITDIVADDERAASNAIDYLKSTKGGRATFLPLTAVKPRDLGGDKARLTSEPGILGTAADFVKTDEVYASVTSSLLGRVLVAETLDCAVRFSRKYKYSHKVVTLTGEVINPGGSITGGSADKRLGILSRKRELAELAKVIEDGEALSALRNTELDGLSAKLSAVSGLLERSKAGLHELMIKSASKETAISRGKDELSAIQRRGAELNKQDEELLSRLTAINIEIREQKNAQKTAEAGIEGLLTEIAEKQEILSARRKARDAADKRLNALLVEISRLTESAAQTENAANRAEESAQNQLVQADKLRNDIDALDIEKEAKISHIDELEQRRAELELERNALDSDVITAKNAEKIRLESELSQHAEAEQEMFKLESRLTLELERMRMKKEAIASEAERLHNEMWEEYGVTPKTARESEGLGLSPARLRQEENRLKAELREMGGTVNVGAVEEYRTLAERHGFMTKQRDDIALAQERLAEVITELNRQMEERFREQFAIISQNFGAVFEDMFGGGTAFLRLTDDSDALNSGIEIIARPPGKALQNMNLLSGGERALCAMALLFGILRMKPAPFCVLDEVETSLDDANVRRFARFLRNHADRAQFLLITHRKGTMESADALYGVTMQEAGVSKLVSVRFTKEDDGEGAKETGEEEAS